MWDIGEDPSGTVYVIQVIVKIIAAFCMSS